ncbi:LysE family translocator [Phaeobacter inhibens]|uniref:LysE family translocator n=1 Tax=Phaeobacter inhibens TaxID=221822 RepID=UPI0001632EA4|nr:LysE family translocator [Phaeobacter inhibens]AFO89766.1 lysE type translocator-like protein [Phaeobacter inhibens DSM 17395]
MDDLMADLPTLFTFFIAAAAFAWIPGPAMLYTTAQTIAKGKAAGWMAVLGIHLGGYVHVIAAALGLAIVFQTIPALYVTLKFAGALYLCYLGYRLLRSEMPIKTSLENLPVASAKRAFFQSVTVEVLNPKTAIFFIAFLPQFTDASAALPMWGQFLILGIAVNVMFSIPDAFCVVMSSKVMSTLAESTGAQRLAQRLGGVLLIGLGLKLAASRN